MVVHFWNDATSSFYMTSDNHESLIIRPKNNYDLSLPSGNSVSSFVMLRLFHLTQEQEFLKISTKIMESQAQMAAENPFGFGYLLNTLYIYLQKPTEITIINDENSGICKYLNEKFIPESILVTVNDKSKLDELSKFPFFKGKHFVEKTSVFVCKDFTCSLPLYSIDEIESNL